MGSGDRVKCYPTGAFGFGLNFALFPYAVTLNIMFLFWGLSIGFGKAYDETYERSHK